MNALLPEHSYRVSSNPPYFYTGHLTDGTQMLIGVQSPDLVGVVFSVNGEYLRTLTKQISQKRQLATQGKSEFVPDFVEDDFSAYIYEWQMELKVISGTISVKQFYLSERYIGISDLPEHYQEVLDHPEDFSEERLRELQGDVQAWRENGEFVLYWDEDYYLNREGKLEST